MSYHDLGPGPRQEDTVGHGIAYGKKPPFRTQTGQTGKDAYIFESAAIANAQRELDRRFRELREIVAEEQPELLKNSTDFLWAGATSADHFTHYLMGREKEFLAKKR